MAKTYTKFVQKKDEPKKFIKEEGVDVKSKVSKDHSKESK